MKQKDQDRLLICAIAVLCLAALVYGGIAMIAWLASRGINIKEVDAAAWTQAVGSVAAIATLIWQRSHEVAIERENAQRSAVEQQNGARRLVQAAENICAEFAAVGWPAAAPLSDAACGLLEARVQAIGGALKRVDAHALPAWRHTESVLVAIAAMDALRLELSREVNVATPLLERNSRRAALVTSSWLAPFKAMAGEFATQLRQRNWVMSDGLDSSIDPA